MKQQLRHKMSYYILGLAMKGFFMALYGYVVGCVLLLVIVGVPVSTFVFTFLLPWFAKGALTLGCGAAIVSLLESI